MKRSFLSLLGCAVAMAQVPVPHPMFGADAVHEIRLRFAQPDWYEQLTANYRGPLVSSPYLSASFEWGAVKFSSIGVRFKGNAAYYLSSTRKKPFRLKLDEFVKGQEIAGMEALNLSNGLNDPSFVREKVYYEMAADLGLKTPRSNFAALYINDEYWGLYVLGEVVNEEFLKTYFGSDEEASGNLYKGNIGATFHYLGEYPALYKEAWEKQSNEDEDDWRDLIALTKLIRDSTPETLRANLEPLMDVDSFLTALALDNATVNLDSYAGVGQNFNIYRRPSDGRWVWIVWDPSLAFGAHRREFTTQQIYEIALEWTLGNDRPLATKLWSVPAYRERYYQIYKRVLSEVFVEQTVIARMHALRELIRPYVAADTQKLVTQEQFDQAMTFIPPPEPDGSASPGLEPFVRARLAYVNQQLAQEITSSITVTADTSALTFALSVGGTADPQRITLSADTRGPASFYSVTAVTPAGANWLQVSPTGSAIPGAFEVSVSGSDLAPGIHNATIHVFVAEAANSPIVIPVSLVVTNPDTAPYTRRPRSRRIAPNANAN